MAGNEYSTSTDTLSLDEDNTRVDMAENGVDSGTMKADASHLYEDNSIMLGFTKLSIASGTRHLLENISGFVVKGMCLCLCLCARARPPVFMQENRRG